MSYKVKNEEQQVINRYMKKMGYKEVKSKVYQSWSKKDTDFLKNACHNRLTITGIARHLKRTPAAIRHRITKLDLNYWEPDY